MTRSEYLKPALTAAFVIALIGAWYWFEHRSPPEEKETQTNALVIVTKSTNACFSDMVRGTGYVVPRREAVVGVDQEGSKVSDVLVREGDMVADNQELARLTPPPAQPRAANRGPAAAPASPPAAGPGPAPPAGPPGVAQRGPAGAADIAARAGSGPRHRGQDHRRRTGLAPGRPDVSHRHQQRARARRRGAGLPGIKTQSGRDGTDQPGQRARPGRPGAAGFTANRSRHPARPCPDYAGQQPAAQGRHVCPRQHRRQAQLRRRDPAHRH